MERTTTDEVETLGGGDKPQSKKRVQSRIKPPRRACQAVVGLAGRFSGMKSMAQRERIRGGRLYIPLAPAHHYRFGDNGGVAQPEFYGARP